MTYTPSPADLSFIRKSFSQSTAFLTICAGFLPAQLAGVLAGLTATGPRFMIPSLLKQELPLPYQLKDPRTKWVERRWCRDGKVWTSGALLNGLDMVREVAKEYWPELAAVTVPLAGMPVRSEVYEGMDGLPGVVGEVAA
jgi:transcriptional regulator GlxA family with amidase domain